MTGDAPTHLGRRFSKRADAGDQASRTASLPGLEGDPRLVEMWITEPADSGRPLAYIMEEVVAISRGRLQVSTGPLRCPRAADVS